MAVLALWTLAFTSGLSQAAEADTRKGRKDPKGSKVAKPRKTPKASKDPGERGLALAKRGDCVKAVPLLEEAERKESRPQAALALAGCYVALGDLLKARATYRALAATQPTPDWSLADRAAAAQAGARGEEVDARIPELKIRTKEPYEGLVVEIDGEPLADPSAPVRLPPDRRIEIVARARGRDAVTERLVLPERARRELVLELPISDAPPARASAPSSPARLGARGRALVVPQLAWGLVGDGGATVVAPGGAAVLSADAGDADVTFAIGYASYRLGDTPFKPAGTPDTEWEFVSSDLKALYASVGLSWTFDLNASRSLRLSVGGSLGAGWTFLGALRRTQAYPPGGEPGDPETYKKCRGPNDPRGTFRYCNELDKDADHYGDFEEPSWLAGGSSPTIYPWLSLPEFVLSWSPDESWTLDLELGLTLGGVLTGLGFRRVL